MSCLIWQLCRVQPLPKLSPRDLIACRCKNCITDLLHYRRRGEPRVFLQDCFGKAFPQPCEVVLPHICQVLTVVNAGWLISSYETFNEPRAKKQIGRFPLNRDCTAVIPISFNLQIDLTVLTYFLMTLTAHALFSRSFLAIRPLQQFSILVAIKTTRGKKM